MTATLLHGDCLLVMPTLDPNSVSAVVCDPPYGLSFMGKAWDHGVPGVPFWTEALRVAKPGAYLVAFGGTRTYHRLTCAIEDAGWEIHDCLSWLYGSGFPKHKSKLKPAWEPIVLARKPAQYATPLNVDACRIGYSPDEQPTQAEWNAKGAGGAVGANGFAGQISAGMKGAYADGKIIVPAGRWPANVCLDEDAARLLDEQSGTKPLSFRTARTGNSTSGWGLADNGEPFGYSDTGGASRFFYTAKASRKEREAGLDGMPARTPAQEYGLGAVDGNPRKPAACTALRPVANHHPTVKPLALMRWLCRLVTPPGGLILDPFTGSGTTGCAAVAEGFRFVGIEREAEYVAIAEARIAHHTPTQLSLDGAA